MSYCRLGQCTIPTTAAGLRLRVVIPRWMPVQLVNCPRHVVDLPRYVLVGSCGFMIYVCAMEEQKVTACQYICDHGTPVNPSTSSKLFTVSTLPVSSVTLLESFEKANITAIAIFCYGMKCRSHMDPLTWMPAPTCTSAKRRYDIGCNRGSAYTSLSLS